MKEITNPLESLEVVLVFDSRDWAGNRRDAWIYGIICGWENDDPLEGETADGAINEICQKYGFEKDILKMLRKNYLKLKKLAETEFNI